MYKFPKIDSYANGVQIARIKMDWCDERAMAMAFAIISCYIFELIVFVQFLSQSTFQSWNFHRQISHTFGILNSLC